MPAPGDSRHSLRNSSTVAPIVMRSPSVERPALRPSGRSARAVRRSQVGQRRDSPSLQADLRVPPRGARSFEHDLALGQPPDRATAAGPSATVRSPPSSRTTHARRRRRRRLDLSSPSTSAATHANSPLLQLVVHLEGRPRAAPPGPSRARRRSRGPPCRSSVRAPCSACSNRSPSLGGEREHEVVRGPDLAHADVAAGVHLPHHALRELDRLHAAAERLGEQPLDEAPETSFEVTEDRHGVR